VKCKVQERIDKTELRKGRRQGDRFLPWSSALTLEKHSEPDEISSTKVGSKTETGLGCSDSLLLAGDSG